MTSDQNRGALVLSPALNGVSSLMECFCAPDTSTQLMQSTVHSLTSEIIANAQRHEPTLKCATLIPILRGGLPIKPFPRQKDESGPIILLDTVIATGDTLNKLCDELSEMDGCAKRSVVIVSCYAAPAALDKLAMHPVVKYIVVARKAEKCDNDGYLVPYTNSDIGDKIYGAKSEKSPASGFKSLTKASKGVISTSETKDTMESLGTSWKLTDNGPALEREIQFKSFKNSMKFITDVASEAVKQHHPD